MCIKCYETQDIEITDDGWVPVQHAIHREMQLAVVRIPAASEKERKYFLYLAAYLENAQLPFIETIYDSFMYEDELILIVRRPQITLNDFFLKSELTDNESQLAAYSIAMGVFMAHRHKLYVNDFSFRDVLIFEDQYICLSVKQFFKLPCGCWNSKQDLSNMAHKCLLLNNMGNISEFPNVFLKCEECNRSIFDLTKLDEVNNVFMRCNSSNSSVFKLSEVVLKELNWPKIVSQTFLSTARISPNVDGSKMLFSNHVCKFETPKSNKRTDQHMYESKEITKVMLYTGVRNKSQPNMPPEIMKAANKIANVLKVVDDEFLTYLDPLYSPTRKDEMQIDDFHDDQMKVPLDQHLRASSEVINLKQSPFEQYLELKKSDDLAAAETQKSQPVKLSETQKDVLKHEIVSDLDDKKDRVDLYSVFICLRLYLQNSEFEMRMSDQPFPLDVQFTTPQYSISTLQFPGYLASYSLADFNFYSGVLERVLPLLPLYDVVYCSCMSQYAGLLLESWSQMLFAQCLKQSHQFDQQNRQKSNIPENAYNNNNEEIPGSADESEEECTLDQIEPIALDIKELATSQTRFARSILLSGAPQICKFAQSRESNPGLIYNFLQEIEDLSSHFLQTLAACLSLVVDVHTALYCIEIAERRIGADSVRYHYIFNFREPISPLANKTEESADQLFFYYIIYIIAFYFFEGTGQEIGAQLLLNAIRPQILQKFAESSSGSFCGRQIFGRPVLSDFENIPRDSIYYHIYQELCENVNTICSCNNKKPLCGSCSSQANILKQKRADGQRALYTCEAAADLQLALLQLLVDFRRCVMQQIGIDNNISVILCIAMKFDVLQLQKMAEQICDLQAETGYAARFLADFDEKCDGYEHFRLAAAILRNIDAVDDQVVDLRQLCLKIMRAAKRIFMQAGEQAQLALYHVLDALRQVIRIYTRRIQAFQSDIGALKPEELLKKYNYIDFSDQAQYLEKVLNISQEMLAFFEFDENVIDKIAQLARISANLVEETSLFHTRPNGYLDVIIDFAIDSLTFCNSYLQMVSAINQLKENNKQLIASVSLISDRPRLEYHLIFTQEYIADIVNLVAENPSSLEYGFSFESLQKIVGLATVTKINQQFLTTLASVEYVKKLLLFYDFDTVEDFFVKLLKAMRLSSGFESTVETVSTMSTQRELSSSLMGSFSLPPKTPNVQNMNMSLVKPMSEEFKLLSQHEEQMKALKLQEFLTDSAKILGRKYINAAIAFLSEAAFDQLFFDDDAQDPYDLISGVATQYLQIFNKNGRLPDDTVIRDIAYYLAFCRENQRIVVPFKKLDLMQMTFQVSLSDQVLPMLMSLLYDHSREHADQIIERFAHEIILIYQRESLTVTAFHLIYSLIKFSEQSQSPNDNYKGLIAQFFSANSGRFAGFSDDFLKDVLLLFTRLLEGGQYFGFVEAKMPLELLKALNMRSCQQLKDTFLAIFELCKDIPEIRENFRESGFNSYLEQTKFDERQKEIQKQLLVDYKK